MPEEQSQSKAAPVIPEPPGAAGAAAAAPVPLSLLGELLIAVRKERGLTQQQLAERLGSHQEAVARMERERYRGVSLERLVKVMEALEARIMLIPEG